MAGPFCVSDLLHHKPAVSVFPIPSSPADIIHLNNSRKWHRLLLNSFFSPIDIWLQCHWPCNSKWQFKVRKVLPCDRLQVAWKSWLLTEVVVGSWSQLCTPCCLFLACIFLIPTFGIEIWLQSSFAIIFKSSLSPKYMDWSLKYDYPVCPIAHSSLCGKNSLIGPQPSILLL